MHIQVVVHHSRAVFPPTAIDLALHVVERPRVVLSYMRRTQATDGVHKESINPDPLFFSSQIRRRSAGMRDTREEYVHTKLG